MKKETLARTQVLLKAEQLKALSLIASQEDKSVSSLLREWVDQALQDRQQKGLAEAANALAEIYYSDGDLVGYSTLDGDDFSLGG
ncbi:MAG: hypothetical protein NTZ74_10895 [Chloroflexi bacterium]|nr:hypothetical protein [Chloroflexota bacterium]